MHESDQELDYLGRQGHALAISEQQRALVVEAVRAELVLAGRHAMRS
jgi:hypothetical protein